jgi:hypothetical protein
VILDFRFWIFDSSAAPPGRRNNQKSKIRNPKSEIGEESYEPTGNGSTQMDDGAGLDRVAPDFLVGSL